MYLITVWPVSDVQTRSPLKRKHEVASSCGTEDDVHVVVISLDPCEQNLNTLGAHSLGAYSLGAQWDLHSRVLEAKTWKQPISS